MSWTQRAFAFAFLAGLGAGVFWPKESDADGGGRCRVCPPPATVTGATISPSTVQASTLVQSPYILAHTVDAGTVIATYGPIVSIDAGVVNVNAAAGQECAIGLQQAADFAGVCWNKRAGSGASAPYIVCTASSCTLASVGNIMLTTGSANSLVVNTGAAGAVDITGSRSVGTCTLDGATPAVCTATVLAGSVCTCSNVGTTAVIAALGCAVSVTSTTLTITSGAAATHNVNYHCF